MPAPSKPAAKKPAAKKPTPKPAAKKPAARKPAAKPETVEPVNDLTRHASEDAIQGHFAQVTDGEHKGQTVAYLQPLETDKDGRPVTALVRFRDLMYHVAHAVVPFKHLAPTDYKGGR